MIYRKLGTWAHQEWGFEPAKCFKEISLTYNVGTYGGFHKWGYRDTPIAGWFVIENPMNMDNDWGYLQFRKRTYGNTVIGSQQEFCGFLYVSQRDDWAQIAHSGRLIHQEATRSCFNGGHVQQQNLLENHLPRVGYHLAFKHDNIWQWTIANFNKR